MRDAEITNTALLFPGAQGGELGVEIAEVMYLDEIERLRAQARERAFHLVDPGLFSGRPNFGGEEEFFSQIQFTRQVADHALGGAVHWRGIDHLPAELGETAQHLPE